MVAIPEAGHQVNAAVKLSQMVLCVKSNGASVEIDNAGFERQLQAWDSFRPWVIDAIAAKHEEVSFGDDRRPGVRRRKGHEELLAPRIDALKRRTAKLLLRLLCIAFDLKDLFAAIRFELFSQNY